MRTMKVTVLALVVMLTGSALASIATTAALRNRSAMSTSAMNLRKNVRAKLHLQVVLAGTDREGKPFEIKGQSADFSRKGLGVILDRDVLSQGSLVAVSSESKFRSHAIVQWVRRDPDTGRVRVGLRLLEYRTSIGFKIAASFLLLFAFVSQATFAGQRDYSRAATPQTTAGQTQQARPAPYQPQSVAAAASNASPEAPQEDQRSWIERALADAAAAKPSSRQALVNIRMSENSYASGQTISASVYQLSNPSDTGQSVELKTWLAGPGITPIAVGNQGADGLYVLPPGLDEQYGPVELLPVRADLPSGEYEFSARILDPVTGETVGGNTKSFTISTSTAKSPEAMTDGTPSVAIDCQVDARDRGTSRPTMTTPVVNSRANPAPSKTNRNEAIVGLGISPQRRKPVA